MKSAKVEARLVHGGEQNWSFGLEFLAKLETLDAQGLKGKTLIHAVLTDDWGAPPASLRFRGLARMGSGLTVRLNATDCCHAPVRKATAYVRSASAD